MTLPLDPQTIQEKIAQKIEEGRVAMRPRWYFVLRAVLAVLGVVLVLLIGLYLVSFVVFVARTTDIGFLPEFGWRGVGQFLYSLPWIVIGLAFVFVLVLELLVRRYAFAYRRPILYTLIGGLLFVALGGAALAYYTPIHGPEHRLPLVQPVYRHYEKLPVPGVHRARVLELRDGEPEVRIERPGMNVSKKDVSDRDKKEEIEEWKRLRVRMNKGTSQPRDRALRAGDTVVIFGEEDGEDFRAFGIHRLELEEE